MLSELDWSELVRKNIIIIKQRLLSFKLKMVSCVSLGCYNVTCSPIYILRIQQWSRYFYCSAFSKTWLLPELWQVLSCKSLAVFLHFLLEEKGSWGPFYQLQQVLAKGRHLLQILLKALYCVKLMRDESTNKKGKLDEV